MRPKDQPDPLGRLDLSDSEDDTNNQIIDECENMKWDGGFYRETKGSHGREVTNEKEVLWYFGRGRGRGGGTPLPPP